MKANLESAYTLLHEGSRALADMEFNGIRIDEKYCVKLDKELEKQIHGLRSAVAASETGKIWKKLTGDKFNIGSNDQLGRVLFDEMGVDPPKKTAKGNWSTDQEALEGIDLPVISDLLQMRKLEKARGTYLNAFLREVVNGFVHPSFPLHLVKTYRGSSEGPNFQNIPIRDPEIGKMLRQAIIPRSKKRQILELDISGAEVRVGCGYHHDPRMIEYTNDSTKDMHRDMAMECYKLEKSEVGKWIRHCGKNMFVFPQFYGDYYAHCAENMWKACDQLDLKTNSGTPLKKHLREVGIKSLGMFERHVKGVEGDFWNRRFKVYTQWKKNHFKAYLDRGYIDTLTGFRCSGVMSFKDAVNYPIQGSAFHCNLWALIQLNDWLQDNDMESVIICQIHDSIILDIIPEERDEIIAEVIEIMTVDLLNHWDWINVPMVVEFEIAPPGSSWCDVEEYQC